MEEAHMSQVVLDYVSYIRDVRSEFGIDLSNMYNMDQTAVFFENVPNTTIDVKGAKSISISTDSSFNARVTVLLAVSFTGVKLPPLIAYKGTHYRRIIYGKVRNLDALLKNLRILSLIIRIGVTTLSKVRLGRTKR